jgi:hypothetical protein
MTTEHAVMAYIEGDDDYDESTAQRNGKERPQ